MKLARRKVLPSRRGRAAQARDRVLQAAATQEAAATREAAAPREYAISSDASEITDFSRWVYGLYAEGLNISGLEGSNDYRKVVDAFPASSEDAGNPYPLSGFRRNFGNLPGLLNGYKIDPEGYICVRLIATFAGVTTHYSHLYWSGDTGPSFICLSPTYISRDGEYRRRLLPYSNFVAACESNAERLQPFEEAVVRRLEQGDLILDIDLDISADGVPISETLENARVAILAFAAALQLDLMLSASGVYPHISPNYVAMLAAFRTEEPALAQIMQLPINGFIKEQPTAAECGQKLMPMTLREVMQPYDYNLAVWRELIVTQDASDLLVNQITSGVAIYGGWTYIGGASEQLFEETAMLNKYKRSLASARIIEELRAARRALVGFEDQHASALSAHLYDDLEYTQSYLTLSDVAMFHVMEHVGITLRSMRVANSSRIMSERECAKLLSTRDTFARLLFDYAYTAHCLHLKLGIAHGDLHGNNKTINFVQFTKNVKRGLNYYSNPVTLFVIGPRGEADTFALPATGYQGCIIDYSRAILGPAYIAKISKKHGQHYAETFYRGQVNRALRALHRHAPDFVTKHQNSLKAAILERFDSAFAVICAADFVMLGMSTAAMLREEIEINRGLPEGSRPLLIADAALELAERLEEVGRAHFIKGLYTLASGKPVTASAGDSVLREVFASWLFSNRGDTGTMEAADAYNLNNTIKYSLSSYDTYPPWCRVDQLSEHIDERNKPYLAEMVALKDYLENPSLRVQIVAEKIRAAEERIDGPPVAVDSSWIND